MSIINIDLSDTVASWRNKNNQLAANVGDLTQLQTTVDSNLVGAINSIFASVDSDITAIQAVIDSDLVVLQAQVTSNDSDIANLSINDLTDAINNGNDLAIGTNAYPNASAGITTRNTAIGIEALKDALGTTVNNTALGYKAVSSNTSGSDNTGIGHSALFRNQEGVGNTALGDNAALGPSSGNFNINYNTAVGANAYLNGAGNYNTAVGYGSLGNISNSFTGGFNTALGFGSGDDLDSTAQNNIIIGYDAQATAVDAENEITLGNEDITRFRVPGAGIDNTSAALSGTTPSVDVSARDTYTLTTSGNTTFTFTNAPAVPQIGTFSLIVTGGGSYVITWPASVKWAGGTAPGAPPIGGTSIYAFYTPDAGTTYYGFLAGDDMS